VPWHNTPTNCCGLGMSGEKFPKPEEQLVRATSYSQPLSCAGKSREAEQRRGPGAEWQFEPTQRAHWARPETRPATKPESASQLDSGQRLATADGAPDLRAGGRRYN